jgi:hypothetical protein
MLARGSVWSESYNIGQSNRRGGWFMVVVSIVMSSVFMMMDISYVRVQLCCMFRDNDDVD